MSADATLNTTTPSPQGVAGGGGPSPLQIGRAFIKQYYNILLTAPSKLNRFYQPDSTVSRGMEPSAPASPSAFNLASSGVTNGNEESPGERVRKAFFDWAGAGAVDSFSHTDDVLRIDFERGAIDAQESIGGGILLVVTGHMFLPGSVKPSPFVHTFFLNNAAGPGRKKQFLVKNDILRFLEPAAELEEEVVEEEVAEEEVVEVKEESPVVPEIESSPVVVEEPVVIEQPAPVLIQEPILVSPPAVEPIPLVPVEYEPSADEEKVEEVDEIEEPVVMVQHTIVDVEPATEEEKTDVTETSSAASDSSPAASPSSDGKKSKRNRKKRGSKSRSRSNSPRKEEDVKEETPEKPKTPGSWASLVASGGGPKNSEGGKKGRRGSPKGSRGVEKPSNNQDSAKAPPQSQPSKESAPTSTPAAVTPQSRTVLHQRTPEATLFIRNIPDKTQESEIRGLFEHHGVATGHKILGITLNPNRGFCFVDFDGPAAVSAIVSEANTSLVKDPRTGRKIESSFMVHGRVLEVERKVPVGNKGGGGSGGGGSSGRRYNRSHSPKDGGGRYRGSRGSGGGIRRSPPRGGGGNR